MKSDILKKIQEADLQGSASFSIPDFHLESLLLQEGYTLIAGVDEAGRGALAGPLSVGLTIYDPSVIKNPPEAVSEQIRDSKKLTHPKRLAARELIHDQSLYSHAALVSHRIIDRSNIVKAIGTALEKLIAQSPVIPEIILMDGTISFDVGIPMITVKKGDNRSLSIASASIEAKVTRDKILDTFDALHPGYGFKKNKGYGTQEHRDAIVTIGHSPIHRRTYEPLKSILSGQGELFDP